MPIHADSASVDAGFDALDYSYEQNRAAVSDIGVRGERYLWRAVIHQAFCDLEDSHARDEARRWLLRDRKDFPLVCDLAGLSPVAVRLAALRKTSYAAALC